MDDLQHPQPGTTAATQPRSSFPLVEAFRRGEDAAAPGAPPRFARLLARARRDPQLLLAVAVTVPVLAMEVLGLAPGMAWPAPGVLAAVVLLCGQLWLTSLRTPPTWLATARLWVSLAFVVSANLWADPSATFPMRALILPIVALAAARGGRGPNLVVVMGLATMLAPVLNPALEDIRRQSVVAVTLAAVVMAIGSRSVVSSLEHSQARLRQANARDRRRARQLEVVEAAGRLLAREGPTPAALGELMRVLEHTFGYRYPSVYVWDGTTLRLGAQRNYRFPIEAFSIDMGVIGRVARTREAVYLPDVRGDPDFLSADPNVTGEIGIPLLSDDQFLGVLNVETSGTRPLERDDFAIMQIVGDRLAAALALGRERQSLTERAQLLDRLTAFSTTLSSSLDPATMDDEVAAGAAAVVPADLVVLVNREVSGPRYLITAVTDGNVTMVGEPLEPGASVSWRAITSRALVVDERMPRSSYPDAASAAELPDELAGMAAPMIVGADVIGVVTWLRADLDRTFTPQEREIADLLAGKVGLALVNARLHQQTADAAFHDPLTGLHNRRHFDATVARDDAIRRRMPAEHRPLRSAILFDLDNFGLVNKRHGHQVGDRVLRLFADTLLARARSSDLVARYGGEEFVVILENATREAAAVIAEDVRAAFAKVTAETPDGDGITSTVSAGCATLEAWEVECSVLVERADVALAMAKHGGRNLVVSA